MYYYIYIEKQHSVFSLLWLLPISGQLVVTFNIILQTIVQLLFYTQEQDYCFYKQQYSYCCTNNSITKQHNTQENYCVYLLLISNSTTIAY